MSIFKNRFFKNRNNVIFTILIYSYEYIKIVIIKNILMDTVIGYIHVHEECFHKGYFMKKLLME